MHHREVGGDLVHHADVVGDQDVSEPQFLLKIDEQVQDLRLDGDVERRRGLVADEDRRPRDQGAGNGDALALAA